MYYYHAASACEALDRSEQVGVASGAGEFEDKYAFLDLVDEKPVGCDVTFPVVRPVAGERMVAIGGRQWFPIGEFGDNGLQLFNRQMALDRFFIVAFEGGGTVDLVFHDSRSFQKSSKLEKCLRVGSLTMRSPSSIAAMVSAFGNGSAEMVKGMRFSRTTVLMYTVITEDAERPMLSQKSTKRFLVGASSENVMFAIVFSPICYSYTRIAYTNFTQLVKLTA